MDLPVSYRPVAVIAEALSEVAGGRGFIPGRGTDSEPAG